MVKMAGKRVILDEIYRWDGWGGRLKLGSGECRLQIFDLTAGGLKTLTHLRPLVVIVTDIPGSKMSVKSCASHIATRVVQEYGIDKNRMLWVEYYPAKAYGPRGSKQMPESFEAAEFTWHGSEAIKPKWRKLQPPILDVVRDLVLEEGKKELTKP